MEDDVKFKLKFFHARNRNEKRDFFPVLYNKGPFGGRWQILRGSMQYPVPIAS